MAGMSEKQQLPVYSANNPTSTAPNVINVLPPANVGQQYRDQRKSLLSHWFEPCILTTWQCLHSVLKVSMKGRQSTVYVELSRQS